MFGGVGNIDLMGIVEVLLLGATIWAILRGPVKAVEVTRRMDEERAGKDRKLDLFRGLMCTRQLKLSQDHVRALNLISIDFYDVEEVLEKYKSYVKHLYKPLPEINAQQHFFEERDELFVELLYSMGKNLGYHFDKKELEKNSYTPVGWAQDEDRVRKNASLLGEMLEGKRPLQVTAAQSVASPYPPPPSSGRDRV